MKRVIKLTESDLTRIVKRVILEQNLVGKTVNLFEDKNESKIFKTIKIRDIFRKGDFLIIKEVNPKILKLKDSEKGVLNQRQLDLMKYDETIHRLKKISGEVKGDFDPNKNKEEFIKNLEQKDFEILYYIECNQKYLKNAIGTSIYDDPYKIDFSGFDDSFRESGYQTAYYNKKFIPAALNQFCKSGNKPIADYEP
jgi:hypothetical protein